MLIYKCKFMDNKKIFSEIYKKKMWTPENLKIKEDLPFKKQRLKKA